MIGCRHLDHLGGLPIEIGIEDNMLEVAAGWIAGRRGRAWNKFRHLDHREGIPIEIGIKNMPGASAAGWIADRRGRAWSE